MIVPGKKVFRSFNEFRRHFFPKQYERERAKTEVETILDEAKFDQPDHKRRLIKDDEELMREMDLAGE